MLFRVLLTVFSITCFIGESLGSISSDHFSYAFDLGKINARLNSLFLCSFGKTQTIEEVLSDALKSIKNNQEGEKLLNRLGSLFTILCELQKIIGKACDPNIYIIENDRGTYFAGSVATGVEPLKVSLNINLESGIAWHDEFGLCSVIPALSRVRTYDGIDCCTIGMCVDPYWMTLAHELIHMEHFLMQELNKYICSYIYDDFLQKKLLDQVTAKLNKDKDFQSRKPILKNKMINADFAKCISSPDFSFVSLLQGNIDDLRESIKTKIANLLKIFEVTGLQKNEIDTVQQLLSTFQKEITDTGIIEYRRFFRCTREISC